MPCFDAPSLTVGEWPKETHTIVAIWRCVRWTTFSLPGKACLISSSLTLIYHCYFHTSPWVISHPLTCIMELGGCKVLIDKIERYHPNHIHIQFPVIFLTSAHPSAINVSYSICLSVPTHSAWKLLTAWWIPHFCTLYPYTCYVRTAIYAVNT